MLLSESDQKKRCDIAKPRVRAIFENSLDGIVIFEGNGICLEANAAAAALVNVPRNQLIGCRLCDFCEKGFEEVWAELRVSESGEASSGPT